MFPRISRHGFTLVEMLVTLCILIILIALSLGGFGVARQKVQIIQTLNRQHSLGMAMQSFCNDNDGALLQPQNLTAYRWTGLLAPYLNFQVDSSFYEHVIFKDPTQEIYRNSALGTFGYNIYLEKEQLNGRPLRQISLSNPGRFPILATADGSVGAGLRLLPFGPPPKALTQGYTGATDARGPSPNFGKFAVFLFADWHSEAINVCDSNAWPWNDPNAFRVQ